jgi:uncharacterized membrane-anchored protein YitT (DUF2179 family)
MSVIDVVCWVMIVIGAVICLASFVAMLILTAHINFGVLGVARLIAAVVAFIAAMFLMLVRMGKV